MSRRSATASNPPNNKKTSDKKLAEILKLNAQIQELQAKIDSYATQLVALSKQIQHSENEISSLVEGTESLLELNDLLGACDVQLKPLQVNLHKSVNETQKEKDLLLQRKDIEERIKKRQLKREKVEAEKKKVADFEGNRSTIKDEHASAMQKQAELKSTADELMLQYNQFQQRCEKLGESSQRAVKEVPIVPSDVGVIQTNVSGDGDDDESFAKQSVARHVSFRESFANAAQTIIKAVTGPAPLYQEEFDAVVRNTRLADQRARLVENAVSARKTIHSDYEALVECERKKVYAALAAEKKKLQPQTKQNASRPSSEAGSPNGSFRSVRSSSFASPVKKPASPQKSSEPTPNPAPIKLVWAESVSFEDFLGLMRSKIDSYAGKNLLLIEITGAVTTAKLKEFISAFSKQDKTISSSIIFRVGVRTINLEKAAISDVHDDRILNALLTELKQAIETHAELHMTCVTQVDKRAWEDRLRIERDEMATRLIVRNEQIDESTTLQKNRDHSLRVAQEVTAARQNAEKEKRIATEKLQKTLSAEIKQLPSQESSGRLLVEKTQTSEFLALKTAYTLETAQVSQTAVRLPEEQAARKNSQREQEATARVAAHANNIADLSNDETTQRLLVDAKWQSEFEKLKTERETVLAIPKTPPRTARNSLQQPATLVKPVEQINPNPEQSVAPIPLLNFDVDSDGRADGTETLGAASVVVEQSQQLPATTVQVGHTIEPLPTRTENKSVPKRYTIDPRKFSTRVFDQLFGRKQSEKINTQVQVISNEGSDTEIKLGDKAAPLKLSAEAEKTFVENIKNNYYAGVGGWWKKGCGLWRRTFNKLDENISLKDLLAVAGKNTVIGAAFQEAFDAQTNSISPTGSSTLITPLRSSISSGEEIAATYVSSNASLNLSGPVTVVGDWVENGARQRSDTLPVVSTVLSASPKETQQNLAKDEFEEIKKLFLPEMAFEQARKALEAIKDETDHANVTKQFVEWLFSDAFPRKEQLKDETLESAIRFSYYLKLNDAVPEKTRNTMRALILSDMLSGDFDSAEKRNDRAGKLCTDDQLKTATDGYFSALDNIVSDLQTAIDKNNWNGVVEKIAALQKQLRPHCKNDYDKKVYAMLNSWLGKNKQNLSVLNAFAPNEEQKVVLTSCVPGFTDSVIAARIAIRNAEIARQAEILRQAEIKRLAEKCLEDLTVKTRVFRNDFDEKFIAFLNGSLVFDNLEKLLQTQEVLVLRDEPRKKYQEFLTSFIGEQKPDSFEKELAEHFRALISEAFILPETTDSLPDEATLEQTLHACKEKQKPSRDAILTSACNFRAESVVQRFRTILIDVFNYPLEVKDQHGQKQNPVPTILAVAADASNRLKLCDTGNQPKLTCVTKLDAILNTAAKKITEAGSSEFKNIVGEILADLIQQLTPASSFQGTKFNSVVQPAVEKLKAYQKDYPALARTPAVKYANSVTRFPYAGIKVSKTSPPTPTIQAARH